MDDDADLLSCPNCGAAVTAGREGETVCCAGCGSWVRWWDCARLYIGEALASGWDAPRLDGDPSAAPLGDQPREVEP